MMLPVTVIYSLSEYEMLPSDSVAQPAKMQPSFVNTFSGSVISLPSSAEMLAIVPLPPFASNVTV